ncbi:hypothetical protein JW851_00765 [Candidatus Woesearchaeota archaeon]|nr:hypothetical protein [Candidatus Woesearchaeota archaeon]
MEDILRRFMNHKLFDLDEGLIKICFSFKEEQGEELALIMSNSLASCVNLPNNALCYNFFLRDGMKAAMFDTDARRGLKPQTAFSGQEIRDEHIANIDKRVIHLNPSFYDFNTNFNGLLIACNSPYYKDAIREIKRVLFDAGFDVDSSTWEDYKSWELDMMQGFNEKYSGVKR